MAGGSLRDHWEKAPYGRGLAQRTLGQGPLRPGARSENTGTRPLMAGGSLRDHWDKAPYGRGLAQRSLGQGPLWGLAQRTLGQGPLWPGARSENTGTGRPLWGLAQRTLGQGPLWPGARSEITGTRPLGHVISTSSGVWYHAFDTPSTLEGSQIQCTQIHTITPQSM